ncbi:MAG: hypothetical protein HC805_07575 [Alkalinema sp. RL_2_19]|nr:hypothetical protein [Alkalinema sp. RL_2_19]
MPNPLFSRYSQGENRVTASTLAVFERISFALVERILQTLCQEQNLSLLTIKNQFKPKNAAAGKPVAFTMGQRYVSLANLNKHPQTTTELMSG